MARVLALAGWGQPYDALAGIVPEATHFDYADYETAADAVSAIAAQAKTHEVVVGWSLGGQLAVRVLAGGKLGVKKLVLIAVPYQFVESPALKLGMPRDAFEKFCRDYEKNPARTLNKAWELAVMGDDHEDAIRQRIAHADKAKVLAKDWLKWLHQLDEFTCETLRFDDFPPTLLVYGENDMVVAPEQSRHFARVIPQAKLVVWKGCGHAPHWHDQARLKQHV